MKRLLVSIWTLIYLCTASGFNVYAHFCMERLVEASLFSAEYANSEACTYCGMESGQSDQAKIKAKTCCAKELTQVKTKIHQQGSDLFLKWDNLAIASLPTFTWARAVFARQETLRSMPAVHGPPMAAIRPIFLDNQSFLI